MYHVFVLSFSLGEKEMQWAVLFWKHHCFFFIFYFFFLIYSTYFRGGRSEVCVVVGIESCNVCGGSLFLWELIPPWPWENPVFCLSSSIKCCNARGLRCSWSCGWSVANAAEPLRSGVVTWSCRKLLCAGEALNTSMSDASCCGALGPLER